MYIIRFEQKPTLIITKQIPTTMACAKKTNEITISSRRRLDSICKEFNEKFPYLRLGIFAGEDRKLVESNKEITPLDGTKTIAAVRQEGTNGSISISGNKKIKNLEAEFDEAFGLFCQVCYTDADGDRYYTGCSNDEKTLAALNEECEKKGCIKGEWK